MKKQLYWLFPLITLLPFVIWTILLLTVDVKDVGGISNLGFSTLNLKINDYITNHSFGLFNLFSDILLYASFATIIPFVVIGIIQLVKRKSLLKVDRYIYYLLIGYVLMVVFYLIFNYVVINCSPKSVASNLKPSYPSSHVMISIVLYSLAYLGLCNYVELSLMKRMTILGSLCGLSVVVMVFRLFTGEHYFTDIIGGLFLAAFIISVVLTLFTLENRRLEENNDD